MHLPFSFQQMEKLSVTSKQVEAATRTDPVLSKVLYHIRGGWQINAKLSYNHTGHEGLN